MAKLGKRLLTIMKWHPLTTPAQIEPLFEVPFGFAWLKVKGIYDDICLGGHLCAVRRLNPRGSSVELFSCLLFTDCQFKSEALPERSEIPGGLSVDLSSCR